MTRSLYLFNLNWFNISDDKIDSKIQFGVRYFYKQNFIIVCILIKRINVENKGKILKYKRYVMTTFI